MSSRIFPLNTLPQRIVGKIQFLIRNRNAIDDSISFKEIARYLPAKPVIVEAGAHNGSETLEMLKFWPQARIHAFEPVPVVFAELETRTLLMPQVTRYPLALAEYTGVAELFISSGGSDASSSLMAPKEHLNLNPHVKFDEKIIVQTITLDEWKREQKITQVDFLWLDMQGYELQALKAGTELLRGVKAIYTEVNTVENYEGTPLVQEVKAWLGEQGFKPVAIKTPWPDGGNALFVR